MSCEKVKIKQLQDELIRVKAERDAYRSLVVDAMRRDSMSHASPARIDRMSLSNWFPIADMKPPAGF